MKLEMYAFSIGNLPLGVLLRFQDLYKFSDTKIGIMFTK